MCPRKALYLIVHLWKCLQLINDVEQAIVSLHVASKVLHRAWTVIYGWGNVLYTWLGGVVCSNDYLVHWNFCKMCEKKKSQILENPGCFITTMHIHSQWSAGWIINIGPNIAIQKLVAGRETKFHQNTFNRLIYFNFFRKQ